VEYPDANVPETPGHEFELWVVGTGEDDQARVWIVLSVPADLFKHLPGQLRPERIEDVHDDRSWRHLVVEDVQAVHLDFRR